MSKTKIKNIRLDEQSNFKRENACRRITKCLLKVQCKTKETGPFFATLFLYAFPVGIILFCHATLQLSKFHWSLELEAVNYIELFEDLNFETVQDVKIGPQTKD